MRTLKGNALAALNERRMQNAFLIRTLERDPDARVYEYNGSAAVYERKSGNWLFGLKNEGDFSELIKAFDQPPEVFYVNTADFEKEIRRVVPVAGIQRYVQYNIAREAFRSDSGAVNSEIKVVPVDKSWTEFILTLYKSDEFGSEEYIGACIEANPGFGALYHGERIGFVLIHKNGEIGPMVISEKFRGKGAGCTLMQRITPVYAAQASIGCGFVLPENAPSRRMMEKSCFVPLDGEIMWVYRGKGAEK